MRSLFIAVALLLLCSASAQPYKYGCHYFRNAHPHPPQALTHAERDALDELIARSDTFDILHYDIAVDVTDYTGETITAATTIQFTPRIANTTIRFDLVNGLTVDSVVADGAPLPFVHADAILAVQLPEAVPGQTYALTVHYHGQPERDPQWGGFYFEANYIYSLGIGLSTIPPYFGKVWYPCFDSFVERAGYTYHVKSAGTFRAHCQGEFQGEIQLGGDTVIRTYDLEPAITTHIAAIAVADYRDSVFVHSGAYGNIPVKLTAKPANLNTMVARFASIGEAIDAYEFWYGPYPYSHVGYVHTTDGAMEIATNVAYPEFMNDQSLMENRGLFGHELAHHWWGNKVTPRTHNDMWLKEGPAEYSAHLLEEWAFGQEAFVDVVKDNQLDVLTNAHVDDGSFLAMSPLPDEHIYGTHSYNKGASVMHNLRGYLGDTLFRQALRQIQVQNADTTLDSPGFLTALANATGLNMQPFFDAQVFAPGFSVFVVDDLASAPSGGQWNVDLQLRQRLRSAPAFHDAVPLDITLVGADRQRQEYHVTAGGEFTDLSLTCAFEPVMAVVNRYNRLNQARMDHERVAVPGVTFPSLQPRTEFRLYADSLADSTLVRIEHIWAAPDADNVGWGVDQISTTHYWIVDGIWPAGTALHARLNYNGTSEEKFDFDLYGISEGNAMLVYRPTGTDPWELAPDYTLEAGNTTNGSGFYTVDVLRKGQYAFANGNAIIGLNESAAAPGSFTVLPNPANEVITVHGSAGADGAMQCEVIGVDGRLVMRASAGGGSGGRKLDVSALADGAYVLAMRNAIGVVLGTARFHIQR
jgi:aminopeptidase N